jgi:tellurite resistance protein
MSKMSIAQLVPTGTVATEHGNALLEVAFLMSAVDGHLADEELGAFNELAARVRGREVTKDEIGSLLEKLVFSAHTVGVPERLREVAKTLPAELHAPAFTVAVALAMVDNDASVHEDELVGILADALGLKDRVAELSAAARAACSGSSGGA